MSKITLAPNAAGTGTLTVAAPNTNTDRTLTLPDVTTTLVGTDATQTLTNKSIAASQLTGALPAIDGSALTGLPAPTTAQVGTATAGLAADAVGSYAWLSRNTPSTTPLTMGTTYAGSTLAAFGLTTNASSGSAASSSTLGVTVSGTWRAMGTAVWAANNDYKTTLFLRIS